MQALIDMIAGLVAMLAAAALSQFGLEPDAPSRPQREIHRVPECQEAPAAVALAVAERDPDC